MVTNPGKEFKSKLVTSFCEENGIEYHVTSTEHSEANGRVERLNRTIREYIRKRSNPKIRQKNDKRSLISL
ncbi:putative Integrase, catalytic core, Ribonuclease H-like protein [Trachipleistophora hominis]|uniref:Putative Integrase, catalytic core, Ribonuclease H-like protein n=1 Tax=Trachipleistophora hominis TaxID=72359 RepID=L7JXA5_TRAHO|nr:putative Integrase, catalytic core, Ribonuclease H-like protein [Trachipleistophora hominis]